MRVSTMRGMAAGGLLGLAAGAGLMMMPQGKRMKRVVARNGSEMLRQIANCWVK